MDLPPELKQEIFILLKENELEVVGEVFPDIVNDSYFKACYQYSHYSFYMCCRNGLIGGVRIHSKGINVNNNKYGWMPLHTAAYNHRPTVVQILLNNPLIKVNPIDPFRQTPLHLAIDACSIDVVKILLNDPRVDVNPQANNGHTPLDYALARRHGIRMQQIVELLREAGGVKN